MSNTNVPTLRRSSRVPISVPVLVTSMEPGANFSEVCETMVVSAHGCAVRSPMKLEAGVPLHFHNREGRETTAQVVYCKSSGTGRQAWTIGATFDRPENFWGLKTCPKDWTQFPVQAPEKLSQKAAPADGQALLEQVAAISVKIVLEKMGKQLSDERLKAMLAQLIRPLESELVALKEKLAQGARRSQFEVSLSQIPPELEKQLEQRLRRDLGPQVLKEAREQSEQVLQAAKESITRTTAETHDEFRQRVAKELQAVEQRAEGLSEHVAHSIREQLNRGLGELHQEVVDAGNRVKQLSQQLLQVMRQSLDEDHDAQRLQLEQLQAAVKSESARLQTEIADLDLRMSKLDETASQLESGLDQRLSQMASDAVRSARAQMEGAVELALNDLSTRNARELANQLDEASSNLKIVQKGIEASVAESLRHHSAEALQSFEHSLGELAKCSVEGWRATFADGLNSLVKMLGEQFVSQAASGGVPTDLAVPAQRGSSDNVRGGARR
jgi:hypothetical protein